MELIKFLNDESVQDMCTHVDIDMWYYGIFPLVEVTISKVANQLLELTYTTQLSMNNKPLKFGYKYQYRVSSNIKCINGEYYVSLNTLINKGVPYLRNIILEYMESQGCKYEYKNEEKSVQPNSNNTIHYTFSKENLGESTLDFYSDIQTTVEGKEKAKKDVLMNEVIKELNFPKPNTLDKSEPPYIDELYEQNDNGPEYDEEEKEIIKDLILPKDTTLAVNPKYEIKRFLKVRDARINDEKERQKLQDEQYVKTNRTDLEQEVRDKLTITCRVYVNNLIDKLNDYVNSGKDYIMDNYWIMTNEKPIVLSVKIFIKNDVYHVYLNTTDVDTYFVCPIADTSFSDRLMFRINEIEELYTNGLM